MDQKEANTSNAPIRKRKNTDNDNEAGPSKVVAANPPNSVAPIIEQTGDIFKLDIDCFEESFDYLPLKDLVNVGKTCKRLHQVAGYCFQQNYSGEKFIIHYKGFYAMGMDANHFVPFVQKIEVDTDIANYFVNEQSKFHRLKEIRIFDGAGQDTKMYDLITTKTLAKLEVLEIIECYLDNDFHETIDQCTKLKRLEIEECKTKYDWLDRKIPTLEYFKIVPRENESIEGIPMFLELNPNIQKFSTTSCLLSENLEKFMSSNVKFDDLVILVPWMSQDLLKSLYDSLSELYNRGFYKKLGLYIKGIMNQAQIDELAAVDGLIKMYFALNPREYLNMWSSRWQNPNISREFSSLTNLEEIHLKKCTYIVADLDAMANNLINLKHIDLECSRIDDIMPFIRRSVEMQKIKVVKLLPGVHFNRDTGIINLMALNREREQLPDAQKITLYVQEEIYLATKWAMKETDFGLVRLKRITSYDWHPDFY